MQVLLFGIVQGVAVEFPLGRDFSKSTKEQTRCKIGQAPQQKRPHVEQHCTPKNHRRLLLSFHPPVFSSEFPQPVGACRHAGPLQDLLFRGRGCAIPGILKLFIIPEVLESRVVPYTLHAFRDLRS